jgi:PAS domain S-box-containing protein
MSNGDREEGKTPGSRASSRPEDLALHVLHSLDQPIHIIDAEDCFLFVNKAYAAQYGVRPEAVRGLPLRELIGEAHYDKRMQALLKRAREEGSARCRCWLDFPDGARRCVESDLRLYTPPGLADRQCLIVQSRDVTDREELDQPRRKSLHFQEGLMSSIPALAWIAGKDGRPYFYNDAWLNFTGCTLVEQVRDGWLGMVHPEDRQMVMDRLQYAIGNWDTLSIEFRLRHLMGGYRWVCLSGRPVTSDADRNGDFIASALDIQDNRKRQEELCAALEEERHLREQALAQKASADRANREKSAYLSLASHEIRTPMNPVIGFADLLASNPDLDEDSREMAQMILKAGKNLLKLLDEVLDYAKIEAGILKLSPEPMDVHDLLIEIDNLYAFDAKSRGIELRVSDRIKGDSELFQDRLRLQQVLGTLITHSIKFTHTGYVEVEASTEDVRFNGNDVQVLKFTIRDTGVGMTKEEIEKLFQPFARVESEFSDKYAGTGLGLAISQKLVDAMRGTVSVESEQGQGTTLELVIPMTLVPERLQRTRSASNRNGAAPGEEKAQASVMIVDDESSSREVNSSLMRFLGYECDTASGGEELLEQLRARSYGIILMDIMMPGLDGLEATRRIRNGDCGEGNREAFIIAVTGCSDEEDRERGFKAGINDFLAKPLTIQALKNSIRAYQSIGHSI